MLCFIAVACQHLGAELKSNFRLDFDGSFHFGIYAVLPVESHFMSPADALSPITTHI